LSIVNSVTASVNAQADGRRWVHEIHTDHTGATWVRDWLASAVESLPSALSAYAVQLASDLASAEASAWVERIKQDGSTVTVTLTHSTLAAVRSALRQAYQNATRTEAIMLADFLGTLTDGQLQTLFSMTAGQVTSLRTNRLTPAASLATSIRTAAGQ